jgi:hypothetical protein
LAFLAFFQQSGQRHKDTLAPFESYSQASRHPNFELISVYAVSVRGATDPQSAQVFLIGWRFTVNPRLR